LIQYDKAYANIPEYTEFPMYCQETVDSQTSTTTFSCDVVIATPEELEQEEELQE